MQPAGYVNTIEVSWNYGWANAKGYFLAGDCDYVALPALSNMPELYQNPTGPFYPRPSTATDLPLAGIRCYADLPALSVDALFFTMNVTPSSYSGTIYPPVSGLNPYPQHEAGGIPSNFFGNEPFGNPYGIDMRKAFACCIDYAMELDVAALGEASTPATAIIPGLYGYNASITSPYWGGTEDGNLTMAAQYFNMWPRLGNGFTITLVYNNGNSERQELCTLLQSAIQGINPNFHVNVVGIDWGPYLTSAVYQELSCFVFGWQADFPDPYDFALPFYHTDGARASWQDYSNATMDSLINQAITLPDGQQKLELYSQIQQLAIDDCPSVTVLQPIGRHFEFDWVQGWYYNPVYPGLNFFNQYKFYYPPEAENAAPSQPFSEYLPADVNRDGVVNMKDTAAISRAFGATYSQPIPSNWEFVDDLTNDRTVNMKDVSYVARQFGETSPIGTWGPLVTISPITNVVSTGSSITFTATVDPYHGVAAGRVIQWYYGTLANGQLGPPAPGGTGTTWTRNSIPAGSSYVYCTVTDTFTGSVATARTSAGFQNVVTVESMHAGIYAS